MKKKQILTISIVAITIGIVLFTYRVELLAMIGIKPEVVEDYVCSDVCSENDVKKIYKGVTDEAYCKKIGGTPYTYYGWGEFTACLAD